MKIKTSELKGTALDWAVAKCEGVEDTWGKSSLIPYDFFMGYRYSTDWARGGPIIEREGVTLLYQYGDGYDAYMHTGHKQRGPTPLIAAIRCYVASKLGDEVEVPEELSGLKPQHLAPA